jgi:Ca2+/H+ antiporter
LTFNADSQISLVILSLIVILILAYGFVLFKEYKTKYKTFELAKEEEK